MIAFTLHPVMLLFRWLDCGEDDGLIERKLELSDKTSEVIEGKTDIQLRPQTLSKFGVISKLFHILIIF